MELFVFVGITAMAFVGWLAVKSALRTSREVESLDNGSMFVGFCVDKRTHYGEQILALDRTKRAIALVRCTYWAPHPVEDRLHCCTVNVCLEASDIRAIEACGWEEGSPCSFNFITNSDIPRENSSRQLSINGHAKTIGPLISEAASILGVSTKLKMSR